MKGTSVADHDFWFSYMNNDTSSANNKLWVYARWNDWNNYVYLSINHQVIALAQYVNGQQTVLDTETIGSTQDTWYDMYVSSDGDSVSVWRDGTQILSGTTSLTTTQDFGFSIATGGKYRLDNIAYIGSTLETTTYAYNSDNEQTGMTYAGATTSFSYDDWGRTVSKYRGSYHADYDYHYGDKMISVAANNFPGQPDVAFEYGGDRKLRERSVSDGDYAWYNSDFGWTILNEENYQATRGTGTLAKTYIAAEPVQGVRRVLAHFNGTDTNNYSYYWQDNIRNTHGLTGAASATFDYSPYGQVFASTGSDTATTRLFTGHSWGQAEQLYFAPYRFYSPQRSRWTVRDPLGMVDGPNMYHYAATSMDPTGKEVYDDPFPDSDETLYLALLLRPPVRLSCTSSVNSTGTVLEETCLYSVDVFNPTDYGNCYSDCMASYNFDPFIHALHAAYNDFTTGILACIAAAPAGPWVSGAVGIGSGTCQSFVGDYADLPGAQMVRDHARGCEDRCMASSWRTTYYSIHKIYFTGPAWFPFP